MAKNSRAVHTRIATTINARYFPEEQIRDAYFLDGRFTGKRELRSADSTTDREERGSLFAVFAYQGDEQTRAAEAPFAQSLLRLTDACSQGHEAIDGQINDLADLAVEVTGKATLSAEGKRQAYFAGILVKEAEMAAVTSGAGCAFLYRGDVLYPLTECDYPLQAVDFNGQPVDHLNDYSAGIAGTIRYSNIASVQENDCLLLCNKEVMEALGQHEVLRLLYEAEDQEDAADAIVSAAAQKLPGVPLQMMISLVEGITQPEKSGRLSLFTGPQKAQAAAYEPPTNLAYAGENYNNRPAQPAEPMQDWQSAYQPQQDEAYANDPYAPQEQYDDAAYAPQPEDQAFQPAEAAAFAESEAYAPQDEQNYQNDYQDDAFYDDLRKAPEESAYDEGRRYASQYANEPADQYADAYAPQDAAYDDQAYDDQQYQDQGYDQQGYDQQYADEQYDDQRYDAYDDQQYQDYPQDQYGQNQYDDYRQQTGRQRVEQPRGRYEDDYDQDYRQPGPQGYEDEEDRYATGRTYASPRQAAQPQRGGNARRGAAAAAGRRGNNYYDDYDQYDDRRNKQRRLIIYAVIGVLFLVCLFLLGKMIFGGSEPSETTKQTSQFINETSQNSGANSSQPGQPGQSGQPSQQQSNLPNQSSNPSTPQSSNNTPVSTTQGSNASQPGQSGANQGGQQPPAGGQTYTVGEGDTVGAIARKFYGSEEDKYINLIRDANPDKVGSNYEIYIGDVLKIPPKPAN